MTKRIEILGAQATVQDNGFIMIENDRGLPDPNITGPCQLQVSFLCKPSEGQQRMDPMDMATSETSFRAYVMCCQPCYDAQADEYVRVTHGRA